MACPINGQYLPLASIPRQVPPSPPCQFILIPSVHTLMRGCSTADA